MQNNSDNHHDLNVELVRDLIRERKSDRFWKNIRFFVGFLVFLLVFAVIFTQANNSSSYGETSKGYVALVRLNGMIGPGQDFSAENVLPMLTAAFQDKEAKGVVLDINSGGGTPVQASIIHDAVIDLKNKYHKKVIVVGEDMMASGAYYVAVSADKIYVNPNTLTGSIGVILKEFGFPELIKKLGIERRVYTSGVNKDRLDPFLPQNPEDVAKIREVISEVHHNFESAVEAGRKGKLQPNNDLFTGDFWSGSTALKLGLVDGLGNLTNVIHKEFNVGAYKDYTQAPSFLKNLTGKLGSSLDLALQGQSKVLLSS